MYAPEIHLWCGNTDQVINLQVQLAGLFCPIHHCRAYNILVELMLQIDHKYPFGFSKVYSLSTYLPAMNKH